MPDIQTTEAEAVKAVEKGVTTSVNERPPTGVFPSEALAALRRSIQKGEGDEPTNNA